MYQLWQRLVIRISHILVTFSGFLQFKFKFSQIQTRNCAPISLLESSGIKGAKQVLNLLCTHVVLTKLRLVDHVRLLEVLEAGLAVAVLEADERERQIDLGRGDVVCALLVFKEGLDHA